MNVLHVSSYFAPAWVYGGPPRSILGLCQALQRVGLNVEVFTTTANGDSELPSCPADSFEGVPVHYFPRRFPKRWFNAKGLARALRDAMGGIDLVHIHGLWNVPGWRAAAACHARGVPYVLSPRGMLDRGSFDYHRFRKRLLFALRERDALTQAAFLHATSETEAQAIKTRLPGVNVVVVPNGVTPIAAGAIPRHGVGPVVFLGRLHPTKRLDLLIASFDRLRATMPDVKLVLAGRREGVDPRELTRGREANVQWVGHLSGEVKWALLRQASVLVSCSDSESFGMSVVEALAMGVPVVATRTCPWPELEEFRCGFWVEQDPSAIAEAVERVLRCPDEASRMGRRGRRLVVDRYSWDAVGRSMSAHYRGALEHRVVRTAKRG